ncbi:endo-beta-1,3-glucanase-like protein [Ophiobolus disseminans]|uniref:Endo-beta-1,3-glucanase-like protein n=1 Tax=Ophiobolus disseminans TaxID=1469910 RepID=A0A6A7A115_9PLEO|nr:endo-beta-1,3-glucanase-like protein [Ophiobolus disseminans]
MMLEMLLILLAGLGLVQAAPPDMPGFSRGWSDDFVGTPNSLPDSANWRVDVGTSYPSGPPQWGTGEVQTYTSKPETLRLTGDGNLYITPPRIETQRADFKAQPGGKLRISARIMMPDVTGGTAAGYWPAFWSMGEDNMNGINRVYGVLDCGVEHGGPCKENLGFGNQISCPGTLCQGNFHEFTIEVDRSTKPKKLTCMVDSVHYHSVFEQEVGAETWAKAVHHGHFILLNVAMGGAFPNSQAGGQTPTSATVLDKGMLVDWVAVYDSV